MCIRDSLERAEGHGLRSPHVAHLRGADAHGNGAERAVRSRVGGPAHDGHARLGDAEFRAYHCLLYTSQAASASAFVSSQSKKEASFTTATFTTVSYTHLAVGSVGSNR